MKIIAVQDCKEIKSAEADINVDLGTDKIYVSRLPSFVYKNGKTDIIPITDLYGSDLETNTKNGKIVTNWKLANMDRKIEITGGTELISLLTAIGHEALDPDTVCIGY
jgi:hypothetical protein